MGVCTFQQKCYTNNKLQENRTILCHGRLPGVPNDLQVDDRSATSSECLLILPLSNTFHHLSDPITFARTHTTQENKAGSGAQRTYPNINFQKRLQVVQHLDTNTLVRAERDHETSSSISVLFASLQQLKTT